MRRGLVCRAWRLVDRLKAKETDPMGDLARMSAPLAGVSGGVLFTRMPLVLPPKPKWETDYLDWQAEWHSRSGIHRQWPQWLEEGETGPADESASMQRREPAPLEQEADRSGDRRTVRRRIDVHLYLVLKGKGGEGSWFFPQVAHRERETLRQTCERALETYVDLKSSENLQHFFVGNGPSGMVPPVGGSWDALRDEAKGERVFLIPVELIRGTPKLSKQVTAQVADFAWVAKDEMHEYFKDEETQEYLQKLLQDKSDYYGSGTSQTY